MQLEQCVTEAVAFEERVRAESQVGETGTVGRGGGMEGRWRRPENGMWGRECNMHGEIHEKMWGLFLEGPSRISFCQFLGTDFGVSMHKKSGCQENPCELEMR